MFLNQHSFACSCFSQGCIILYEASLVKGAQLSGQLMAIAVLMYGMAMRARWDT